MAAGVSEKAASTSQRWKNSRGDPLLDKPKKTKQEDEI